MALEVSNRIEQLRYIGRHKVGKEDDVDGFQQMFISICNGRREGCDNGYYNGSDDPAEDCNLDIERALFSSLRGMCLTIGK